MRFYKLPVQKIEKLQNLFLGNKQGISFIEIRVVSTFESSSKCSKEWEILHHLVSILWTAGLGVCCSSVNGKMAHKLCKITMWR